MWRRSEFTPDHAGRIALQSTIHCLEPSLALAWTRRPLLPARVKRPIGGYDNQPELAAEPGQVVITGWRRWHRAADRVMSRQPSRRADRWP